MTDASQLLTMWVHNEHQAVTYIKLSRHLGCTVQESRRYLNEYKKASGCAASFVISGFKANKAIPQDVCHDVCHDVAMEIDDEIFTIELVSGDAMEDAQKNFTRITSQKIFAISAKPVHDSSRYLDMPDDLPPLSFQDMEKYGAIVNPGITRREGVKHGKIENVFNCKPNRATQKSQSAAPKAAVPKADAPKAAVLKTTAPKTTAPSGKTDKLDTLRMSTNGNLTSKPLKSENNSGNQLQAHSNEAPELVKSKEIPKNKAHHRMEYKLSKEETDKRQKELSDLQNLMDIDYTPMEKDDEPIEWEVSDNEEPIKEPVRRRGKRKVKKVITETDEKGYLITREDFAWESFSEDEEAKPVRNVKSKPTPSDSQESTKKATKQTSNKPQKSIMSFFKK